MAKVMVSMPDDLLRDLDDAAERDGTTRSGYLRTLAEADLARRSARRAERVAALHQRGDALGHGGSVADVLARHRPER